MRILFPRVLSLDLQIAGNSIKQIAENPFEVEGVLTDFSYGRRAGVLFRPAGGGNEILIIPRRQPLPGTNERILAGSIDRTATTADLAEGVWCRHPLLNVLNTETNPPIQSTAVTDSWKGSFRYVQEDRAAQILGLRGPQLGALHSIRAHWFVSSSPATIVMPTGTGKTETMLAALVSVPCSKVFVVVPTDALRAQLVEKFATLGILKNVGCSVLASSARFPIVGMLRHIPTAETVDRICSWANVVITTSSIAAQCGPEVQERLAHHCSHLFIDEAHHAEAPTWKEFKEKFHNRKVLQFTATPFREDGKPLEGDIIFKYPLKKAQEEEYFKPIRFQPIVEFSRARADRAICEQAVRQLREDAQRGHILMARVDSVARAREVFRLYEPYREFNPVQLHTGIKSAHTRAEIRRQILSGHSKIVVCVDMLGEGFDLPELKIAAFHDIRKSLAVTLQLAGRFTRARPDLGDAVFIANTADIHVRDELRKLYSRDPDWNLLLPQIGDGLVGEQVSLQTFLRGFSPLAEEIPIRSIKPATSTVVYKTTCQDWNPENFSCGIPAPHLCAQVHHSINHTERTLVIVTARRAALDWADVSNIFSWQWELYVVFWWQQQNLLFVNSSTNAGEFRALAEAVTDENSTLIRGQEVFRSFSNVNRLRLQNIGLTEQLGRNIRYIGRMGADVAAGLTEGQRQNARKSVFAGSGYENGEKTTVGASRKGRIWSHERGSVEQLVRWCKKMGAKLIDTTIDPDEVLRGTLEPIAVTQRPAKMPFAVAWPEIFYSDFEASWTILIDGQAYHLDELSIQNADATLAGDLRLAISSETEEVKVQLELIQDNQNPNYQFVVLGDRQVRIRRSDRSEAESLSEFFYDHPPVIWFVDGSCLEGCDYTELKRQASPYVTDKITVVDWTGTNIQKEVQGPAKEVDSIQARLIRDLMTRNTFDMIIDDHSKGEAADIVTINLVGPDKANPTKIEVEFYHCKKSGGAQVGSRLDDLYEVCGQAQKSVLWVFSHDKSMDLFTHLLRREESRRAGNGPSRYEHGDRDLLLAVREMSRYAPVSLKIFIVQPGLSKSQASRQQLELLSVTENYLMETYQLSLDVIASA